MTGKKVPGDTFLFWYGSIQNLTDEEMQQGYAECDRKVIADEGNGRKPFPPAAAVFVNWAKHGNRARGSGAVSHTAFDDPKHPMNDPDSAEYKPRRKGIESDGIKQKRKQAGNNALAGMKGMF